MDSLTENKERQLAKEYILHTDKNIFLTGKAGTGKTTLLKEVLKETDKNHLIAAPTGVAAINAGGVTLHSLFLFPLKAIIPRANPSLSPDLFCSHHELAGHQKFDRIRLDVFMELDMLVIDEISMVRADLLDAIDVTLRRVRGSDAPFGGVQMLVIGDLYQLSPVVRHNIKLGLREYYESPYFFEAEGWKKSEALTIELKQVFRQEDQTFVDMLNVIRDGRKDADVLAKLNKRLGPTPQEDGIITLTTHNAQANEINSSQLEALPSSTKALKAELNGSFPESAYPTPEVIHLKEGAQVMFIRNHTEGLYYNGKIGEVTQISDDFIKVKSLDDDKTLIIEPVEWVNSKYEVDQATDKITKNDVGSFVQFPLRLAWAVTVHKSQGLTFDKVILDLEKTFASGQLYVALSRCRTLDGMFLISEVGPANVITDYRVVNYYRNAENLEVAIHALDKAKEEYDRKRILKYFSLNKINSQVDQWTQTLNEKNVPDKGKCLTLLGDIDAVLNKLDLVVKSFIHKMSSYFTNTKIDPAFVTERMDKAVGYFAGELHEGVLIPVIKHQAEYSVKKNTKAYLRTVELVERALSKHIKKLYAIHYRGKPVYTGEPIEIKEVKISKKSSKEKKGNTYEITYKMHKEGKSIEAISKDRGMAKSTIESHLGRFIKEQRVSIYDLMPTARVEKALSVISSHPDLGLTDLMKKMPFKLSFGELRWVKNYSDILRE